MNDKLLEYIQTQLGYQWCDDATKKLLSNYTEEGIYYLRIYNATADFESDKLASSLLVEYVRYALASAKDDFKVNYRDELMLFSDLGRIAYAS